MAGVNCIVCYIFSVNRFFLTYSFTIPVLRAAEIEESILINVFKND